MLINQILVRRSHRHFKYSRTFHVAADGYEFQSGQSVQALRFIPLEAVNQNSCSHGKGLHVVDGRGHVPQSLISREWRLVARFRALAFDGFEQGTFLAANVASGTGENAQLKSHAVAKNRWPERADVVTAVDLLLHDFFRLFVLVTNIKNALSRPGDQARDNHALDDQVRNMLHDETVFHRARLTLIRIANDVFCAAHCVANDLPFHSRGKSGAAQSAQTAGLKRGDGSQEVSAFEELLHGAIIAWTGVRIGGQDGMRMFAGRGRERAPPACPTQHIGYLLGAQAGINSVVNEYSRSGIASSQAGGLANGNLSFWSALKCTFHRGADLPAAAQMARHIGADAHIQFRGRR